MKYLIFLFYYSLIISILIFLWSIFKSTQPEGLLFTILILPVALYFGLRIVRAKSRNASSSSPTDFKAEDKIGTPLLLSLVVLLTLFVSAFSIFSYTFIREKIDNPKSPSIDQMKSLEASNQKLNAKLDEVKKALEGTKSAGSSQKDVLGLSTIDNTADFIKKVTGNKTASAGLGYITIKDQRWTTLDVYEGSDFSSKVLGKIKYGLNYKYFINNNNWYYIQLDSSVEGWVDGSYVKATGNGAQQ